MLPGEVPISSKGDIDMKTFMSLCWMIPLGIAIGLFMQYVEGGNLVLGVVTGTISGFALTGFVYSLIVQQDHLSNVSRQVYLGESPEKNACRCDFCTGKEKLPAHEYVIRKLGLISSSVTR